MKKFFRVFRILIVVAAFVTAFFMMKEPLKASKDDCALDKEAAKRIFAEAETFKKSDEKCFYDLFDKNSENIGKVLYVKTDETSIGGFGGNLRVVVGIDKSGKIIGVELGENYESDSFINRIKNEGFFEKWNGKTVEEATKLDVDTISGATMSTRAIKSMVALNLSKYSGSEFKTHSSGEPLWLETIVFLLLFYSIFAFLFPQKTAKFRTFHLISLATVFGFIGGYPLSMEFFKNWISNGHIALIPAAILAAALLLSVCTGKNFYCTFLCPFGATQELFAKTHFQKRNFPPKFMKIIGVFKILLLITLYILMIFKVITDFTVFEPFGAFMFRISDTALLPSLIIAAIFLILSLFVNRPWCRFFCPTGTLMSLFTKKDGEI